MDTIEPIERETMQRVTRRLMPLLILGMFCAFVDRANVGMAALTMNKDLGFSAAVFGFGAGLFFFGYFLAELPSNLILPHVGARRWFARILFTWGIMSGLTAFVWNDWSFYGARLLLGVAEAGFYPGAVLYMTWWFPSAYRTRMMALFGTASVISQIMAPPIGGLLMQMDGILGLAGWQWLFVIEALPSVIMAVVTWHLLTDRPKDALWLRPEERNWLSERLESERAQREAIHKFSFRQMCFNPKIWLLTFAYLNVTAVNYGLAFFMPLMIQGLGVSTDLVGVVSALPYVFVLVAMVYWGYHSDRAGERTWHTAGACLVCSAGLAACIVIGAGHPLVTMIALTVGLVGQRCVLAVFWALPTAMLTGTAAAGGFAMISAVGNLGGWTGPWLIGVVKDVTGSTDLGMLCLALTMVISAVFVLLVGHDRRLERIPSRT
jgi:MFS family permease